MTSPLLMFLETVAVWIAGAVVLGILDHFAEKSAKTSIDLSGEKPRPNRFFKWLQVPVVVSLLAYPPYLIYREATKAQARSSIPPQPPTCRLRLGPYEKKWQC